MIMTVIELSCLDWSMLHGYLDGFGNAQERPVMNNNDSQK